MHVPDIKASRKVTYDMSYADAMFHLNWRHRDERVKLGVSHRG